MIRLGLMGATGRMGNQVRRLVETTYSDRFELKAAAGQDDALEPLLDTDVIIDFSLPEPSIRLMRLALERKKSLPAWVVGVTGWADDEQSDIEKLAGLTPVLMSSNFSTGVTALMEILRQAAPMLKGLGYEPVLIEKHHIHKKDAPSGTARTIQQTIAPGGADGVQTHAVRAGEVIGDHEVTFHGPADKIVVGHFAQDRTIFARGALEAALWLGKPGAPTGRVLGMRDFFQAAVVSRSQV